MAYTVEQKAKAIAIVRQYDGQVTAEAMQEIRHLLTLPNLTDRTVRNWVKGTMEISTEKIISVTSTPDKQAESEIELTDKQRLFVEYYLQCLSATEAARLAGYQGNRPTLASIGCGLLKKESIKQLINNFLDEHSNGLRSEAINKLTSVVKPSIEHASEGCVYFLRADNGLIKIGKATNFDARFRRINGMLPYDLEVIVLIHSENIHSLEKDLHIRFAGQRVRYEWFRLSESDLNDIGRDYSDQII